MQIQCPKCKEWVEPVDGMCPYCTINIVQAQTAVDLPKSFYVQKIVRRCMLIVLVVLSIVGIVAMVWYFSDTDDLYPIQVKETYYKTMQGCLPSNDVIEVPSDADEETILKMEQEMYQAHLDHTDCATPGDDPNHKWASRIGSGWLSHKNAQILAKNPKYQRILTGVDDTHTKNGVGYFFLDSGCHGFPISVAYDGMRLYIRSPKNGHIEMAFTTNQTHLQYDDHLHATVMELVTDEMTHTPYTVHKPDIPVAPIDRSVIVDRFEAIPYNSGWMVEPVPRSPILYGVDDDHYTESKLKPLKDSPFYAFYEGEAVYFNMLKGRVFRVVLHVKRKKQSFIIYRVYPLSHDIPTDAQYFDQACKF